ncbi:MAG: helicase-associated domain-containing protein [Gemmatimonadota bacterium]|nr:helicase-associated domain-containing protein [Gemmatimonadota bacterium]
MWGEILAGFLVARLAPLGGARLGRTAAGELCFALTGAGRYLLGGEDDFEYGQEVQAQVVVQPDFEIVFLAPAPVLEAQIARFAERRGKGPGVMFRLTRASVLAAAEAGATAEQIVETLGTASIRELPGNVVRQVRDWFQGIRRVRMRPAVLVECRDAETAARVLAAAGKQVRKVTATLLELSATTRAERSAVLRKLRAVGIFAE